MNILSYSDVSIVVSDVVAVAVAVAVVVDVVVVDDEIVDIFVAVRDALSVSFY